MLVAKHGIMSIGERGQPIRNPAVVVTRESATTMLRLAKEFGLTPAARTAMGTKKDPNANEAERLLA